MILRAASVNPPPKSHVIIHLTRADEDWLHERRDEILATGDRGQLEEDPREQKPYDSGSTRNPRRPALNR